MVSNKKASSTIDEAYISYLVGNRGFEPLTSSTSMEYSVKVTNYIYNNIFKS